MRQEKELLLKVIQTPETITVSDYDALKKLYIARDPWLWERIEQQIFSYKNEASAGKPNFYSLPGELDKLTRLEHEVPKSLSELRHYLVKYEQILSNAYSYRRNHQNNSLIQQKINLLVKDYDKLCKVYEGASYIRILQGIRKHYFVRVSLNRPCDKARLPSAHVNKYTSTLALKRMIMQTHFNMATNYHQIDYQLLQKSYHYLQIKFSYIIYKSVTEFQHHVQLVDVPFDNPCWWIAAQSISLATRNTIFNIEIEKTNIEGKKGIPLPSYIKVLDIDNKPIAKKIRNRLNAGKGLKPFIDTDFFEQLGFKRTMYHYKTMSLPDIKKLLRDHGPLYACGWYGINEEGHAIIVVGYRKKELLVKNYFDEKGRYIYTMSFEHFKRMIYGAIHATMIWYDARYLSDKNEFFFHLKEKLKLIAEGRPAFEQKYDLLV